MTLLVTSCTDRNAPKVYPNELTIDNWETFVDAPQSLINELAAKEVRATREARSLKNRNVLQPVSFCIGGPIFGQVTAWNGSGWSGIEDVDIDQGNLTASTNGSSTLDSVLIQRHIVNILPFDLSTDNGLRQFVASDVNNDGSITTFDLILVRQLILNNITAFPGKNMAFIPLPDFNAQVIGNPAGLINLLVTDCYAPAASFMDRRAIKMGDASGNFSF